MHSISLWTASSNQNSHDLSDAGFFYTGVVLYEQNPVYYKNKHFLVNPANTKIVLLKENITLSVSIAVLL